MTTLVGLCSHEFSIRCMASIFHGVDWHGLGRERKGTGAYTMHIHMDIIVREKKREFSPLPVVTLTSGFSHLVAHSKFDATRIIQVHSLGRRLLSAKQRSMNHDFSAEDKVINSTHIFIQSMTSEPCWRHHETLMSAKVPHFIWISGKASLILMHSLGQRNYSRVLSNLI
jgi:hypothetical protein